MQNAVSRSHCRIPAHNLIAVFSCIQGTTVCLNQDADNEINEYLIEAGDLKQLVYQLKFNQGVLNHLFNPRLDFGNSQKDVIYPSKY